MRRAVVYLGVQIVAVRERRTDVTRIVEPDGCGMTEPIPDLERLRLAVDRLAIPQPLGELGPLRGEATRDHRVHDLDARRQIDRSLPDRSDHVGSAGKTQELEEQICSVVTTPSTLRASVLDWLVR